VEVEAVILLWTVLTLTCCGDSLICHYASVEVDGRLAEPAWREAPKVALVGPGLKAYAMSLWDGTYWYLAFAVEDTDVWATSLKEVPEVLVEDCVGVVLEGVGVYISPMNVVADFKVRGRRKLFGWDLPGLVSATEVSGTLNFPERDSIWTAEIALPWKGLGGPPSQVRLVRVDDGRVQFWPSRRGFGRVRRKK